MTQENKKLPTANNPETALLTLDLQALIQEVKEEEQWQKTGRGARTLYKSQTLRLVLNVMQAGTEIKQHHASGPISVQVLEGKINFYTEGGQVALQKGQLLTLKEYIPHRVEAPEAAAFLLTVAPLPMPDINQL